MPHDHIRLSSHHETPFTEPTFYAYTAGGVSGLLERHLVPAQLCSFTSTVAFSFLYLYSVSSILCMAGWVCVWVVNEPYFPNNSYSNFQCANPPTLPSQARHGSLPFRVKHLGIMVMMMSFETPNPRPRPSLLHASLILQIKIDR